MKNCHAKLIATGSVADTQGRGHRSNSRGLEVVQVVQEMFTHSPKESICQTRRESWLSCHCVQYVLKNEPKWRAWKPHYCQALSAEDCYIHVEFWEVMSAWYRHWSDLWSDEAVFHIGGFVNRHNYHYWAGDDPRITSEKMLNRPKVMVWCGLILDRIVGPLILCNVVNAKRYITMLIDEIWPVISS